MAFLAHLIVSIFTAFLAILLVSPGTFRRRALIVIVILALLPARLRVDIGLVLAGLVILVGAVLLASYMDMWPENRRCTAMILRWVVG